MHRSHEYQKNSGGMSRLNILPYTAYYPDYSKVCSFLYHYRWWRAICVLKLLTDIRLLIQFSDCRMFQLLTTLLPKRCLLTSSL